MHLIRLALALVAALIISTSAYAADKGGKLSQIKAVDQVAPTPAVMAPSWTGPYIGVAAEYTMQTTEAFGGLINFDANDISFGITAGYDVKLPGSTVVVGVMGDYMFQRNESAVASFDRSWFLGARAGILFSPTVLVYGLVGHTQFDGSFATASLDSGLTLGAGIEAHVMKNVSLKLEFRRADLGDTGSGFGTVSSTQDSVRAGLTYRFDSPTLNIFGN